MACIQNVLGRHAPSPIAIAADENGNQDLRANMPLRWPSSMPRNDVESWGNPRISVPLRPPFSMLTDLAREQLELSWERMGSCLPVDRVLQQPYGPPPAVAETPLATTEVNSSGGLTGWRSGKESIHVSQVFSGGPPALIVGGTRVSSGATERGGNNARLFVTLPGGQGFFPPRGSQVRGPPHIPTLRSGVMMELPQGTMRMSYRERMVHVSLPLGGPQHPVDNLPRPIPLSSSTQGLSSCATAHGFLPPLPPSFNPFLAMPISFAPPPIVGPPQPSYYANYPSWGMLSASSNRENK